jgi:predicted RNA binding protein YcfA (HicA-like mRNA interferase family)
MVKREKTLQRILRGTSDASISFNELCNLLISIGFDQRIRGDHHIFTKEDVVEILNLQPKGSQAKPYQVKQVRNVILKYKLAGDDND